jgi:hypothetical protein
MTEIRPAARQLAAQTSARCERMARGWLLAVLGVLDGGDDAHLGACAATITAYQRILPDAIATSEVRFPATRDENVILTVLAGVAP